jgi:hypothetical protein
LLLLSGYIYFFEGLGSDESPNPRHIYDRFYGEYDLVGLEITRPPDQVYFTRTRSNLTQDWQMISPQALPPEALDQARVNGAATRLGGLVAEQIITDTLDLGQFGLAPPSLTVTLTISNGDKIVLQTGQQTPVRGNRYLKMAGPAQPIYVVYGLAVDDLHRLIETLPLRPTPLPSRSPTVGP